MCSRRRQTTGQWSVPRAASRGDRSGSSRSRCTGASCCKLNATSYGPHGQSLGPLRRHSLAGQHRLKFPVLLDDVAQALLADSGYA